MANKTALRLLQNKRHKVEQIPIAGIFLHALLSLIHLHVFAQQKLHLHVHRLTCLAILQLLLKVLPDELRKWCDRLRSDDLSSER